MKEERETNLMTLTMAAIIIGVLVMSGCATKETPPVVVSSPAAECARAVGIIATSAAGDPTSKVVAITSIERLCGSANMQVAQQAPQSLGGTLWTAALQIFDIGARVYGVKAQRDVGIVQSNNATATAISTNGAFLGMGQSIATAGTAGYQYVQAPAPTVTTTTTLSGTGVIGGGQYTGPVTTNTNPSARVCSTSSTGVLTCVGG